MELIDYRCGLTNLVGRATAAEGELGDEELVRGRHHLILKVLQYEPLIVAVLGLGAFRAAFQRKVTLGLQRDIIGNSKLWVLPNPSGLNAHYQLPELNLLFGELKNAAF